jgi:E3 ubiquitin-protein ligase RNF14
VYPEYTTLSEIPRADQTQPVTIRLEIPVELEGYQFEIDCDAPSQAEQRVLLTLVHLPSLVLTLLLPSTYPLRTTPLTMYLHASNGWLTVSDIQKIAQRLRDIWEEDLSAGVGSLWRTCEWIRNGSFLFDIGRAVSSRLIRYVTLTISPV